MIGDLTTLARARTYLGITDASADTVLANLISTQSRFFKSQVGDDLIYQKYIETRDGAGTDGIEPYHQPLQSVDSVVVDAVTVPAAPGTVPGWVISKGRIETRRSTSVPADPCFATFSRGLANVVLTYWAGFYVPAEAATIPATPYQVQAQELFVADYGVKFSSNGSALTKVASSPAAGQYAVDSTGLYTFAAANTGSGVLIAYAYVPADIEQAVWELCAWRYRERDHTGQASKWVGGENVMYRNDPIPPTVKPTIDQYARVSV